MDNGTVAGASAVAVSWGPFFSNLKDIPLKLQYTTSILALILGSDRKVSGSLLPIFRSVHLYTMEWWNEVFSLTHLFACLLLCLLTNYYSTLIFSFLAFIFRQSYNCEFLP